MTNRFYPKGAEKLLKAQVDFEGATLKAAILPSSYTYDPADEFVSDLGTILGSRLTLTNKAVAGGVFDVDDLVFGAVAAGATAKAIILYKDTGSDATSPVLIYLDQIVGWPIATSGAALTAQVSSGATKLFSLV